MPTSSADPPAWPSLALGAAAFAAAEMALALTVGGFFAWGRAEALLFFAFRPWLLLAAAVLLARRPWRERLFFYALALLLAALGESLFLITLGAGNPWPEALLGVAAGVLLGAAIDLVVQAGRRFIRGYGALAAGAAMAALFLSPIGLIPYERMVIGRADRPAAESKPELMLMTGLPIVWGERGGFDPSSRPAAILEELEREFDVRFLDALDAEELDRGGLLLLAQPRALAPAELVALDDWVRQGGRALILTDPALVWPSDLPLGDMRRPPAIGLLGPLLSHWGLQLEAPQAKAPVIDDLPSGGRLRRLATAAPGKFVGKGPACAPTRRAYIADCRIGKGRALLVADADLMRDELWLPPGETKGERHSRTADNPLILADWLDMLAGAERPRTAGEAEWLSANANRELALALGFAPALLAAAAAILFRRRHRG